FLLFFSCCAAPRDLHSFPTRRSSDLRQRARLPMEEPVAGREPQAPVPRADDAVDLDAGHRREFRRLLDVAIAPDHQSAAGPDPQDRKSTRLNSSHSQISYAVFCLKKK